MTAYYNENDPFAAAWLRELIKANLIAQGDVDERSIKEVQPEDLRKYTQCHFFAGIGVWSYALRQAKWSDDTPVWTGSCPCQPFSAAGKKGGFDDTRHLWPDWFRLIRECRPDTIFGEQVASKDGLNWFDLVSTDLEGEGYAIGAADLCAAGVGAPHIRQRLYFVGHTECAQSTRLRQYSRKILSVKETKGFGLPSEFGELADNTRNGRGEERTNTGRKSTRNQTEGISAGFESGSGSSLVANAKRSSRKQRRLAIQPPSGVEETSTGASVESGRRGNISGLAIADGGNTSAEGLQRSGIDGQQPEDGGSVRGATSGFWSNCDWIPCIDGKSRPVEPGTFPLATGIKNRVGLLRGYGNSLTAPVAQTFIEAYLEVTKTG